jgi:hypothetical protein
MKQLAILVIIACSFLTFSSCRKIVGDGPVVNQNRNTGNFTGLDMDLPGELIYTPGNNFSIEIQAQQNILDVIETPVSDNILKLKLRKNTNLRSHETIIVRVTAPDLTQLRVSGSGNIKVTDPYKPASLSLSVSGSGFISIAKIASSGIDAAISGSGDIRVNEGTADQETLSISGSGSIDLSGVVADKATTKTSGSGTTKLHVISLLDVRISGSGDVLYRGSPKIEAKVSGSGRVTPL